MTTKPKYSMIPYQREDRDIYDGLEFDPDEPWPRPEAMYQERPLREITYLLHDRLVGSSGRTDVFISGASFICYDRSNLNVRVGPDCYIAVGVDATALWERKLYLPWEVGKPPDFALEMASESTAENDIGSKREIYRSIGIGEYWQFDASGGTVYGEPLVGERLVNGRYQRFDLNHQADGSLRGYSPLLDLDLSWERQDDGEGWLCLNDPATGQRVEPYGTVVASRRAVREQAEAAEERADAAEGRAAAAETEARELREQLRRLRGE